MILCWKYKKFFFRTNLDCFHIFLSFGFNWIQSLWPPSRKSQTQTVEDSVGSALKTMILFHSIAIIFHSWRLKLNWRKLIFSLDWRPFLWLQVAFRFYSFISLKMIYEAHHITKHETQISLGTQGFDLMDIMKSMKILLVFFRQDVLRWMKVQGASPSLWEIQTRRWSTLLGMLPDRGHSDVIKSW